MTETVGYGKRRYVRIENIDDASKALLNEVKKIPNQTPEFIAWQFNDNNVKYEISVRQKKLKGD